MPTILAHGGAGGAAIEISLAIVVLAIFFAVWLRERRAKDPEGARDAGPVTDDRLFRDEEKPRKDG